VVPAHPDSRRGVGLQFIGANGDQMALLDCFLYDRDDESD
jgi:hypothetical protein